MTAAAYPSVVAALVSVATAALTPLRVVDGYDTSEDPGDVMMVGVPSLADTASISAGSFSQTTITYGVTGVREELGTINGLVLAWNGDGNQALARTAAFGYVDSLGAALRADPTLGVTEFEVKAQFNSGDVLEDQVDGATTAISFTVAYKAIV